MIRIGNSGIDSLGSNGVGSINSPGSDGRSATATALKQDSVNLSSAASLVALAKSSAATPQSRLDSLRAAILAGSYQTDDAQVSQAMVQSHVQG